MAKKWIARNMINKDSASKAMTQRDKDSKSMINKDNSKDMNTDRNIKNMGIKVSYWCLTPS